MSSMRSEKLPVVNQRKATSEVRGRLDMQIIYTRKTKKEKKRKNNNLQPMYIFGSFPYLFLGGN